MYACNSDFVHKLSFIDKVFYCFFGCKVWRQKLLIYIYICITDLVVLCVIVIIDSSKLYLVSLYANTLLPLKSR